MPLTKEQLHLRQVLYNDAVRNGMFQAKPPKDFNDFSRRFDTVSDYADRVFDNYKADGGYLGDSADDFRRKIGAPTARQIHVRAVAQRLARKDKRQPGWDFGGRALAEGMRQTAARVNGNTPNPSPAVPYRQSSMEAIDAIGAMPNPARRERQAYSKAGRQAAQGASQEYYRQNTPILRDQNNNHLIGSKTEGQFEDEQKAALEKELQGVAQNAVNEAFANTQRRAEKSLGNGGKMFSPTLNPFASAQNQQREYNRINSPEELWNAVNTGEVEQGVADAFIAYTDDNGKPVYTDTVTKGARERGISPEQYIQYYGMPAVANQIAKAYEKNLNSQYSVRDYSDYLARKFADSFTGSIELSSVANRQQRQLSEQATGEYEQNLSGLGRAGGTVANLVAQAPEMIGTGGLGGAVVKGGAKVLGKQIIGRVAPRLGTLIANGGNTMLRAASENIAEKFGRWALRAGYGMANGVAGMSGFMAEDAMRREISTGDDPSFASIAKAGWEGAKEGAKTGVLFGAAGMPGRYLTGVAGKVSNTALRTAALTSARTFSVASEAGVMTGQEYAEWAKQPHKEGERFDLSSSVINSLAMVATFKGQHLVQQYFPALHARVEAYNKANPAHKVNAFQLMGADFVNLFSGKNTSSPVRLSKDDKATVEAATGKTIEELGASPENLMSVFSNKEIPWTLRQKISLGTTRAMDVARPRTQTFDVDYKNPRWNVLTEYDKDGNPIEEHHFYTEPERDAVIGNIQMRRDNNDMLSYIGMYRSGLFYDPYADRDVQEKVFKDTVNEMGFDYDRMQADESYANYVLSEVNGSRKADFEKIRDRRNSEYPTRDVEIITRFANANDTSPEEINRIIQKDPIERSEDEQALMSSITQTLHDDLFRQGELHVNQSMQDGADTADRLDIGDPQSFSVPFSQLSQAEKTSTDAWNDAYAKIPGLKEIVDSQGKDATPGMVVDAIRQSDLSDAQKAAAIYAYSNLNNAAAAKNGFVNQVGNRIHSQVSMETMRNKATATSRIEDKDGNSIADNLLTVTLGENNPDGSPVTYYIKSSTGVRFREDGSVDTGNSDPHAMVVLIDTDGNTITKGANDPSLRLLGMEAPDDFASRRTQELQMGFSKAFQQGEVPRQPAAGSEEAPAAGGNGAHGSVSSGSATAHTYSVSQQTTNKGEHYFQDENGNIDLATIPDEIFDRIGYTKAPFRITESMANHVLRQHGKELGVTTPQEAVAFVKGVMDNFDHVRLGDNGALVFSVENGRSRTGKRAVTILINQENGNFYGIKTSGYESVRGLEKRPLLWERGANDASATGAAPASVPTGESPISGGQSGSASHQGSNLEDKDNNLSTNGNENRVKISQENGTEVKPIGQSVFGAIYDNFKGKLSDAARFLIKAKDGIAKAVMHREGVGDVDMIYGNDKRGLYHIIMRHVVEQADYDSVDDLVKAVDETVRNGEVETYNDNVVFNYNGNRVVAIKTAEGQYVLTAYDTTRTKAEKKRTEADSTRLYQEIFGNGDGNLVPQNSGSQSGKDTAANDGSGLHPTAQSGEPVPGGGSRGLTSTGSQPAGLGVNPPTSIGSGKDTASFSIVDDNGVKKMKMPSGALVRVNSTGYPYYSEASPEDAAAELLNRYKDKPDRISGLVEANIKDYQRKLKKAQKAKPSESPVPEERDKEEDAREQAINDAQSRLDHWNNIKSEVARQRTAKAEAEKAEQQRRFAISALDNALKQAKDLGIDTSSFEDEISRAGSGSATAEQIDDLRRTVEREIQKEQDRLKSLKGLENVPVIDKDTPQDARNRGYRNDNGTRIDRQSATDGIYGRESEARFSYKPEDEKKGHLKLIDVSQLQPSHIAGERNIHFFLDEAQPKDRTDKESITKEQTHAKGIRPELITKDGNAYAETAPVVNSRGEVIQGNHRSAVLRRMYDEGYTESIERYKQYLKDHAAEFGLKPEDIDKMEHPVLVNEIDVNDKEAVRLGQMTARDLETGGIRDIDPSVTATKLLTTDSRFKMQNYISVLMRTQDENASISDLIVKNGPDAINEMAKNGIISDTEAVSAFDSRGNLTPEAKKALKNILLSLLFKGGRSDLPKIFDDLPIRVQNGIAAAFSRDYQSPDSERILKYLQKGIEVYYDALGDPNFASATDIMNVRGAMMTWLKGRNTFTQKFNGEGLDNVSVELAIQFQAHRNSQKEISNLLDDIFDKVQARSRTGQSSLQFDENGNPIKEKPKPMSLRDAIKQVLGIDYTPQVHFKDPQIRNEITRQIVDDFRNNGIEASTSADEGQSVLDKGEQQWKAMTAKQKRALETASLGETSRSLTAISSTRGAKVINDLDSLVTKCENSSTQPKTFIGEVAAALGIPAKTIKNHSSKYATFETNNGKIVTIRVSNHNATPEKLANNGQFDAISIVVSNKPNKNMPEDGTSHVVEFYYNSIKLRKAEGKPLADIVRSLRQALDNGIFNDTTGLAEKQEVNIPPELRKMQVYHGSANDFDVFDTMNHLGEGEGSQVFGAGTYVADQKGLGEKYARIARPLFLAIDGKEYRISRHGGSVGGLSQAQNLAIEYLEEAHRGYDPSKSDSERAAAELERRIEIYGDSYKVPASVYKEALALVRSGKVSIKDGDRVLYTVDIPDDNGKNYLQWDKALSYDDREKIFKGLADGEAVSNIYKARQKRLKEIENDTSIENKLAASLNDLQLKELDRKYARSTHILRELINGGLSADDLYHDLALFFGSDKDASEFLHKLGYTGFKVHAARYSGDARYKDNWNYVVFDDKDLKINNKIKFFRTASGEVYGFVTSDGHMYLDPRHLDPSLPIHEYGHLWAAAVRIKDPKRWEKIVNTINDAAESQLKPLFDEVRKDDPSLTGDDLAEEVLMRYSGSKGMKLLDDAARAIWDSGKTTDEKQVAKSAIEKVVSNLKNAIHEFWQNVADMLGIRYRNVDDIADHLIYDALTARNPKDFKEAERKDTYEEHENNIRQNIAHDIADKFQKEGVADVDVTEQGGQDVIDNDPNSIVAYHKVSSDEQKRLDSEPAVKFYRSMVLIDGKLYPPMSVREGRGKTSPLREPTEIGVWERSDENPERAKNGKFPLTKEDGSVVPAAYNPYFHASSVVLNDQFSTAYKRPNLVVVEVEVPRSELTSGYHAEGAKDAVGVMDWHTGPVAKNLPEGNKRKVMLSRYMKVTRILPDSEVAEKYIEAFKGKKFSVPDNTVTPSLRAELAKRGVEIIHTDTVRKYEEEQKAQEIIDNANSSENNSNGQDNSLSLQKNKNYGNQRTNRRTQQEGGRVGRPRLEGDDGIRLQLERDGGTAKKDDGRNGSLTNQIYKEKEIAEDWASKNGKLMSLDELSKKGSPGKGGDESEIWYSDDGYAYKMNNLIHNPMLHEYLDRLAYHNLLFPDTAYELVGFVKPYSEVYPVVRQKTIDYQRAATAEEIHNYMEARGFRDLGDGKFDNAEFVVKDVKPKNVLVDKQGVLRVIDAEIAPKQRDDIKYFRTKSGEVYGFVTRDGKMYLDPRHLDPSLPIHEYGHLWAAAVRQKDPERWKNIVGVISKEAEGSLKPLFDQVRKDDPGLKGDDLAEEVLMRYSGKRGMEKLDAEARKIWESGKTVDEKQLAARAIDNVKSALRSFWEKVADILGFKYKDKDQIADHIIYDALSAKSIKSKESKESKESNKTIADLTETYRTIKQNIEALYGEQREKARDELALVTTKLLGLGLKPEEIQHSKVSELTQEEMSTFDDEEKKAYHDIYTGLEESAEHFNARAIERAILINETKLQYTKDPKQRLVLQHRNEIYRAEQKRREEYAAKYGIKNGRTTLDNIVRLFGDLNMDSSLTPVFERVVNVCRLFSPEIKFTRGLGNGFSGNTAPDGIVKYNLDFFLQSGVSNQDKASTLIHELVHNATLYALDAYAMRDSDEAGLNGSTGRQMWNKLSRGQQKAVEEIYGIYEKIKNDREAFPDAKRKNGKQYGLTDVYEMVAEIYANGEFREQAKKKNLWTQLKDAIVRFFTGAEPGAEQTTVIKALAERIDYLLEHPNIEAYRDMKGHWRSRRNDTTRDNFSPTKADFDLTRERAVRENGIVMPGLKDKMVRIVDVPRHPFKGTGHDAITKARAWASENLAGEHVAHKGSEDEFRYTIDGEDIRKYLSESSTKNSDNLGVHIAALTRLPQIIDNSIDAEIHPDYVKGNNDTRTEAEGIGDANMLVHRLYGAISIDGNVYRVKTTMYEKWGEKNQPHDYRVKKVELTISGPATGNALDSSTEIEPETSPKTAVSPDSLQEVPRPSSIMGAKLLKDVRKSYDKDKNLLSESEKISLQDNAPSHNLFIGERGARAADLDEERSTRIDNLAVARQMEAAGKDPKAIKLATGWERGADHKWRYEVPDADMDMSKIDFDDADYRSGRYFRLPELLSGDYAGELFKAYPELKDVRVKVVKRTDDYYGIYDPANNMIALNHACTGDELHNTLLHEVQHAIQHLEGFAKGGSSTNVRSRVQKEIDRLAEHTGNDRTVLEAYRKANIALSGAEIGRGWLVRPRSFLRDGTHFAYSGTEQELIAKGQELAVDRLGKAMHVAIEAYDDLQSPELYDQLRESASLLWDVSYNIDHGLVDAKEQYLRPEVYDAITRILNTYQKRVRGDIREATGERSNKGALEAFLQPIEREDMLRSLLDKYSDYGLYKALAGEVESRNVESRQDMTPDERRASLAADTEDVSREDQILLFGDGENLSAKPHEKSKPIGRDYNGFSQEEYDRFAAGNIGKNIEDKDIDKFLTTIKYSADKEPEAMPYSKENYDRLYGSGVDTPIGHVKMSQNQEGKMEDKSRTKYFYLAKPTLEKPDFILSVPSTAKEGSTEERPYSYVFVKSFKNEDGTYATYYNAVSVKKDGLEVVVSNYIPDEGRVKREIKGSTLAYIKSVTLPSNADTLVQGNQRTNPVGGSSTAKVGNFSDTRNNIHGNISNIPDERRASLAAETEDVSRQDQIFLFGDGEALSAKDRPTLVAETGTPEGIISNMHANAEKERFVELSHENWKKEFGEEGRVDTPIGRIKMGDGQYDKLITDKRTDQLGMIKPTLERPDVVLETYDPKEGADRDTKYLFIKAFTKPDGTKFAHFESVTVKQGEEEVSISSHYIREKQLKDKLNRDKILWNRFENGSETSGESQGLDKQTAYNPNGSENGSKNPQSISSAKVGNFSDTRNNIQGNISNIPDELRDYKQRQLDLINRTNPMRDNGKLGIRSVDDIMSFDEALEYSRSENVFSEGDNISSYPDVSNATLERARRTGRITVYSSHPIEDGGFVSPSMMMARDYAGGRYAKVYSKRIPTEDVAWLNADEGQYAPVHNDEVAYDEAVPRPSKREEELKEKYKDTTSHDLFVSLAQKKGTDYNDTVSEIANRTLSGRASLRGQDTLGGAETITGVQAAGEIIAADKGGERSAIRKDEHATSSKILKNAYYDILNEIANRISKGAARIDRLGEEIESQSHSSIPAILGRIIGAIGPKDAGKTRASVEAAWNDERRRNGKRRGEEDKSPSSLADESLRELEEWAKDNGYYIDENSVSDKSLDGKMWKDGCESYVYRSKDGKSVIKVTNFQPWYWSNDILHRLDQIAAHNALFPDTRMDVLGFGRNKDGLLSVIVKQPLINGETLEDIYKGDTEKANADAERWLASIGFGKKIPTPDDPEIFYNTDGKYTLLDVNASNIIVDKEGKYHLIDCEVLPVGYEKLSKFGFKTNAEAPSRNNEAYNETKSLTDVNINDILKSLANESKGERNGRLADESRSGVAERGNQRMSQPVSADTGDRNIREELQREAQEIRNLGSQRLKNLGQEAENYLDVASRLETKDIFPLVAYNTYRYRQAKERGDREEMGNAATIIALCQNILSERGEKGFGTDLHVTVGINDKDTLFKSFKKTVKDERLNQIFDKVSAITNRLGIKIVGAETLNNDSGNFVLGTQNIKSGEISLSTTAFNSLFISDEVKMEALLHEMIHAATRYAFYVRNMPQLLRERGFGLTKGMNEAIDEINGIYDVIRNNDALSNSYGIKNVEEMMAELANRSFRAKLKEIGLWTRLRNGIKKFFGLPVQGSDNSNALKELDRLLDYVLDNFDEKSYWDEHDIIEFFNNPSRQEAYDVSNEHYDTFDVNDTPDEIRQTFHRSVQRDGLDRTLGHDTYNSLMRDIYTHMRNPDMSKYIRENVWRNNLDLYKTVQGYLADQATKPGNVPLWQDYQSRANAALRKAGYSMELGLRQAKYLAWLAQHTSDPANPLAEAERVSVRRQIMSERILQPVADGEFQDFQEPTKPNGENGSVSDRLRSETSGSATVDNAVRPAAHSLSFGEGRGEAELTDQEVRHQVRKNEFQDKFSSPGAPLPTTATPAQHFAKAEYESRLDRTGYVWKEAHIDYMQSAQELTRAILGTDDLKGKLRDSENFLDGENQLSSRQDAMGKIFKNAVMRPLDKAVQAVLGNMGKGKSKDKMRRLQVSMIAKSGLERNRVLFMRDYIRDLRGSDGKQAEQVETGFLAAKSGLDKDIDNGVISLDEYFRQLDNAISTVTGKRFDATKHDRSGLTALYKNGKGSYDDARAIKDVMDFEDMVGGDLIRELWSRTKTAADYNIDMQLEGGLINEGLANHVKDEFKWYVPMRDFDEKMAEDVYPYQLYTNVLGAKVAPLVKSADGRTSLSNVDIFAQIGKLATDAISKSLQNQMVNQRFLNFIHNYYNVDGKNRLVAEVRHWIEFKGVDADGKDVWEEAFPEIGDENNPQKVAQIVEDFNNDMELKKKNGKAKIVNGKNTIPYRFKQRKDLSHHIVIAYQDGRKHVLVVNGNPRAAEAINGILRPEGSKSVFIKTVRFMSQMVTTYSPDFMFRNTLRDFWYSRANVFANEGFNYTRRFIGNYHKIWSADFLKGGSFFYKWRKGTLDMGDTDQRLFKEFMDNGGVTGWAGREDIEKWQKEIMSDIKSGKAEALKKGIAGITKALEMANEHAENLARFATYMTSRKMGRSITRSVADAKEVSVNFNRKGAGMKSADFKTPSTGKATRNTMLAAMTAQYCRNNIMFYNAGMQGLNQTVKNFRGHPVRSGAAFLSFALGGFLIPLLNRAVFGDDDNEYSQLPEYLRRQNICIHAGKDNFVTIPLPIELRAMYGLGDILASKTTNPELDSGNNVALDIVSQFSQMSPLDFLGEGSGDITPGNFLMAVIPAYAKPFLEAGVPNVLYPKGNGLTEGLNAKWNGMPVRRERAPYNLNQPAWMRAFNSTGDFYMNLAKDLDRATSRSHDESQKGFVDIDPAQMQHYVQSLAGGIGTTAGNLAQLVNDLEADPSLKTLVSSRHTPMLRTLHYTPTDQNKYYMTRSKWFNYKEKSEKFDADLKALQSDRANPVRMAKAQAMRQSREGEMYRQMKNALKRYRNFTRVINATDNEETRQNLSRQRDLLMEQTVNDLDKLK